MDSNKDGTYMKMTRTMDFTPIAARDSASNQRRARMSHQQYESLRKLDESISHGNPSLFAFTPVAGATQRSRVPMHSMYDPQKSHQRLSALRTVPGDTSMMSVFSDDNIDLDRTRHLLEPQTPAGFTEQTMTTTLQCLPDEDPGLAATSSLYTDFKHCLARHESASDVFDLLASYEEVCSDHEVLLKKIMRTARADPAVNTTVDLVNMIRDEKRTWRLISCLYSDRLKTEALEGSMLVDELEEHASEKRTVRSLFRDNSEVRQAQIVIDWLERNSADDLDDVADKVQHYSENVSWENTLYYLKQKKLRGDQSTGERHIVTQMDPDAPSRQRKPLADLDRSDEVRLLKSMFSFIRAGKIEKAQDLCMYCGQPWRVVSLEGWQLYHDPNMEALPENGAAEIEGNPLRDLWKFASWSISQDENVHMFERAIYGSLCGNLKAMLSACVSWEDFLWANYKTMLDTTVEHELTHSPTLMSRQRPECGNGPVQMPESYWEQRVNLSEPREIFDKIQGVSNEIVRQEAESPFHVIQKHVILEDVSSLIESSNSWVTDSLEETEEEYPSVHPQLLRFISHLILFLRTIGVAVDEEKCERILETYIRYLASEQRTAHLVASYTAALTPEKQVQVYSDFLKTIEDKTLRQEYLEMANEAGLDIPTITKTVVEDIRLQGDIDVTLPMDGSATRGNITISEDSFDPTLEPAMTREDWRKIEALEWLVFDSSQRMEAMKQCNALMRSFLACKKFAAAKEVFQKIPTGSVDVVYKEWGMKVSGSTTLPPEDENTVREHLCMQAYLSAKQSFMDWFKYYHNSKPKPPSEIAAGTRSKYSSVLAQEHREKQYDEDCSRWMDTCKKMCVTVRDKIYNVLLFPAGGWLTDIKQMEQSEEVDRRSRQLELLRKMCIPTLCHLLLTALKNTEGMQEECLHLANVLADEDYQLYKVLSKEEGRKILSRIQDVALDSL